MRYPAIFSADELRRWTVTTTFNDIEWVCARPMAPTRFGLLHRLRTAWRVFTGRYDAVYWKYGQ